MGDGVPVCVDDFERHAARVLPRDAYDYYRSGAGNERTLALNRSAFNSLRIRPRVLRNVSSRDLATVVLGSAVRMPIGIAPTAMQRMAHPDGEIANAKAAESAGTVFVLSTIATSSIEDVAAAAPSCTKWFQLYIYKDREVTKSLIRRAEASGYKAIVLTVDSPYFGIRRADVRNRLSLPPHLTMANFVGLVAAEKVEKSERGSGLNAYVASLFDSGLVWDDVRWLIGATKLPVVLKGVLTEEDALVARDVGAAAVVVSNHGARQIDGAPASIEALPEIVRAVGDDVDVYMDGGIRDGTDVFKALALGAKMVFVGRPALWGLAYDGQRGVENVLSILRNEFDSALGIAGCGSVADIDRKMIVHERFYHKL